MILLLIPPGLSNAQTVNENHMEPDLGDIIPENNTVGPVAIVNELEQGHSIITDIMLTTSASIVNEDYVDEEIFYEATYVDYENEKLVVWLDPAQRYDPVAEDDIQEALGLSIPIEIKYGFFMGEGIGHYDSTGGDSGAPITANIDGTDKIIGVHAGLGCVFESMSEHIDINVDELSPYYICSDSDRYDQYKLISDWGNVADTFNLK